MTTENLKVESATIRVNNRADENRDYNIVCSVELDTNGNLLRVIDGNLQKNNGTSVASFNIYDTNQGLNVTFRVAADEQAPVLAAINAFIESAKAFAAENFSF